MSRPKPSNVEGKVKTRTRRGRLEQITGECCGAQGDAIVVESYADGNLAMYAKNCNLYGIGVFFNRKRALTFARLLRTMALQLPKETE